MHLSTKVLSIQEEDLNRLKENQVSEDKFIEYKQELFDGTPESKLKFLIQVSSFANASGGHLIYGITEDKGMPGDILGIENILEDDIKLKIDNIIRDGIEPRITNIEINVIKLSATGNSIIVLYIPKSWISPHVVKANKHWRFYSRNNAGKYPLDMNELRQQFIGSELTYDKIKNYRYNRISNIVAGETPILMDKSALHPAILIMHLIPLNSFNTGVRYNLVDIPQNSELLLPFYSNSKNVKINFEGILSYREEEVYSPTASDPPSYIQFFRNGIIEVVDKRSVNHILREKRTLFMAEFESELFRMIEIAKQMFSFYSINSPLLVFLTMLKVKGIFLMLNSEKYRNDFPKEISSPNLGLPELLIEDLQSFTFDMLIEFLLPIWNSAGYKERIA